MSFYDDIRTGASDNLEEILEGLFIDGTMNATHPRVVAFRDWLKETNLPPEATSFLISIALSALSRKVHAQSPGAAMAINLGRESLSAAVRNILRALANEDASDSEVQTAINTARSTFARNTQRSTAVAEHFFDLASPRVAQALMGMLAGATEEATFDNTDAYMAAKTNASENSRFFGYCGVAHRLSNTLRQMMQHNPRRLIKIIESVPLVHETEQIDGEETYKVHRNAIYDLLRVYPSCAEPQIMLLVNSESDLRATARDMMDLHFNSGEASKNAKGLFNAVSRHRVAIGIGLVAVTGFLARTSLILALIHHAFLFAGVGLLLSAMRGVILGFPIEYPMLMAGLLSFAVYYLLAPFYTNIASMLSAGRQDDQPKSGPGMLGQLVREGLGKAGIHLTPTAQEKVVPRMRGMRKLSKRLLLIIAAVVIITILADMLNHWAAFSNVTRLLLMSTMIIWLAVDFVAYNDDRFDDAYKTQLAKTGVRMLSYAAMGLLVISILFGAGTIVYESFLKDEKSVAQLESDDLDREVQQFLEEAE